MGTQHRQNTIAHLSEKLPQLTVNDSGADLWLNLWCGQRADGQRQLVARTKVDKKLFNSSETDYHQEVVDQLLTEFVAGRATKPVAQPVEKKISSEPAPSKAAKPLKKSI